MVLGQFTIGGVATVAVGLLTTIIMVGGAVSAGVKLWKFRGFRALLAPVVWACSTLWVAYMQERETRFANRVDEAIGKLFLPDGGASLRDLADRFTEVERRLGISNKYTDQSAR